MICRPFSFVDAQIDRASERRDDAQWMAQQWQADNSRILLVRQDAVLVNAEQTALHWLQLSRSEIKSERASFLACIDQIAHFAHAVTADEADAIATAHNGTWLDLRSVATHFSSQHASLSAYACALLHWQRRKQFCGVCGAKTLFDSGGHRAACSDKSCAQLYFPRTDPAIIVLVEHADSCLLGRQAQWPAARYSALAGFVEPGETLEQAVCREVFEEAGVKLAGVDYQASQPWPFPAQLMIGFRAVAANRDLRIGLELEDARWFEVNDIAQLIAEGHLKISPAISISHHLLADWYREKTGLEIAQLPVPRS